MDPNEPNLGPTAVSELIGVSTDVLRDRRRRGLLNKYGCARPNGRWLYSLSDCVGMFAAHEIVIIGFDLGTAFEISTDCIKPLARRMVGLEADDDRFVMFWADRSMVGISPIFENYQTRYATTALLSAGIPNAVGVTALDMDVMAAQAPAALSEAVRACFEAA